MICFLILCLAASGARAESRRALGVSGDLGLGGLNGKAVTTLQTGVDIHEGNLELGVFGRVRLFIQDSSDDGPLRDRDWDEASDFVHIVRYLRYQHTFESRRTGAVELKAQIGEMLGYTLGHGTLMRDYSNISDPDHPHSGLALQLGGSRWTFDFFIDNFINPSVVASRLNLAPITAAKSLRVGASLLVDPRAPLLIRRDGAGVRMMDSAFNLDAETTPLALIGIDVEYTVGSDDRGRLTPYVDLNTTVQGLGLHLGSLGQVPLGKSRLRLQGQVEYQLTSPRYAAAHVETFYDVDRYQAGLGFSDLDGASVAERSTKLSGLVHGNHGGHGVLTQAGLTLGDKGSLKMGISYRPGPDALNLWWRGAARPVPRLQLGVLVLMRGVGDDHSDADGVMAMAEGRLRITDNVYTMAQYIRTWSLRADTRYYGLLHAFNICLGATWSG